MARKGSGPFPCLVIYTVSYPMHVPVSIHPFLWCNGNGYSPYFRHPEWQCVSYGRCCGLIRRQQGRHSELHSCYQFSEKQPVCCLCKSELQMWHRHILSIFLFKGGLMALRMNVHFPRGYSYRILFFTVLSDPICGADYYEID